MNFAVIRPVLLILLLGLCSIPRAFPQSQAETEELKRLAGEVADLRDANAVLQRKLSAMQKQVDSLRDALRESQERVTTKQADFTTRDDLKKMAEKIQEVDQRREADRKLILEEFEKLAKTLAQQPAEKPERKSSRRNERADRDKDKDKDTGRDSQPETVEGTFYPYKIQPGDTLLEVLAAYNKKLVSEGRPKITSSQVKRANPKLNPDNLIAGREILLPVPDKKQ